MIMHISKHKDVELHSVKHELNTMYVHNQREEL